MQTQGRGHSSRQAWRVSKTTEALTKEAFESCVQEALSAFQKGDMQKVVLARRSSLELTQAADPVALLRQVVGGTQRRHYLYILEPTEGAAFVSLTPERLC